MHPGAAVVATMTARTKATVSAFAAEMVCRVLANLSTKMTVRVAAKGSVTVLCAIKIILERASLRKEGKERWRKS